MNSQPRGFATAVARHLRKMTNAEEPEDNEIGAEITRRQKLLVEQLEHESVVEVVGVVEPGGPSGWGEPHVGYILQVGLASWKYPGGRLQTKPLRVQKDVSEAELDNLMGKLRGYDVVRIRARVVEDSEYDTPQALLVEVLGKGADAQLKAVAAKLQEPVTFEDDFFGLFTLDRGVNWYEAQVEWGQAPVKLALSTEGGASPNSLAETAHALWQARDDWDHRLADYAISQLLDLKNGFWLGDGEGAVTEDEFRDLMKLEAVTIYPGGLFEFWYADGELFWGHAIMVSGTLEEGPNDAGVYG